LQLLLDLRFLFIKTERKHSEYGIQITKQQNMKKYSTLLVAAAAAICLSSCVSSKKIIYFQGSEEMYKQAQDIIQTYEMRLKTADQILVKITCDNPELLEIFNYDVTVGSGNRTGNASYSNVSGSMGNIYGYTIDNKGYVTLPAIGKVFVINKTCDEAAEAIEQSIIAKNLINEPDVKVQLLNARVAVLGAVKSPRVVSLTSERNTILDVLSQCGDVSDQALRKKVSLYREENGKRERFALDLTQTDIFNSPAFYVQQNDVIYVEPNKSQNVKSSAFSTFLGVGGSIISAISSVVAVIIALSR